MVMHPMVESKNHFKQIQGSCKMFRHFLEEKQSLPRMNMSDLKMGNGQTAVYTVYTNTGVDRRVTSKKKTTDVPRNLRSESTYYS